MQRLLGSLRAADDDVVELHVAVDERVAAPAGADAVERLAEIGIALQDGHELTVGRAKVLHRAARREMQRQDPGRLALEDRGIGARQQVAHRGHVIARQQLAHASGDVLGKAVEAAMELGKIFAAVDQLHDEEVPVRIVGAEARHQRVDLGQRRIALHHHVAGGLLLQGLRGERLVRLHLLDEQPRALAADDGVVVMPARPLDDHHVAVDHGPVVEKASLEEVVDEVVLGQDALIVAPSGRVERRRSGRVAGPLM